jgi:hypothetical protein
VILSPLSSAAMMSAHFRNAVKQRGPTMALTTALQAARRSARQSNSAPGFWRSLGQAFHACV